MLSAHEAILAARAMIAQLHERNYILCLRGPRLYGFVHRTFLEYLTASEYVRRFEKEKTITDDDLISLFDEHCRDAEWREVLRLICGQINEQFVGRIVEHLATRTDLDKWDRQTPLPELPLAIYCLSEVRNVAKLDEAGELLMDSMIEFVSRAKAVPSVRLIIFMRNELLPAAKELGVRWPGSQRIEHCALSQVEQFAGGGLFVWAQLVASLVDDPEPLRALALHSSTGRYRTVLSCHALRALAEKSPDDTTRRLLTERAVEDEDWDVRATALRALAKTWPDDATRRLLAERAVDPEQTHWERAVNGIVLGSIHSEFGRIVATKDLDGVSPYIDPLDPIPREHIEEAAEKVGIDPGEVDAQVASLSEHLGWDITKGARVT